MNRFLPERKEINPRWFKAWAERFGSGELGAQMSQNERLFERLRNQLFYTLGVDPHADLDPDDVIVAHAYAHDRERLAQICGLVMHGEIFRNCIGKSDFDLISKLFSIEDLKLAVSLRHHHPDASSTSFSTDMAKLAELVQRTGNSCIDGWKACLDEQMAKRIELLDKPSNTKPVYDSAMDARSAWKVTVAVSHALANENAALAA